MNSSTMAMTVIEQSTAGQKRKERIEDDFDYSLIDPRLFDGAFAEIASATASNIPSPSPPTNTPFSSPVVVEALQLMIPGLGQLRVTAVHDSETRPTKRIKSTIPPSPKSRLSTHRPCPPRKSYIGSPSEYLEAKRQAASHQLVTDGFTPPPPPRPLLLPHECYYDPASPPHPILSHPETHGEPPQSRPQSSDTYLHPLKEFPPDHDVPYHELSPQSKQFLTPHEIRKTVDDVQARQKRSGEKETERKQRSVNIAKYQKVMASLERTLTHERRMKNAGAEKNFARPGRTAKRFVRGRKLKEGVILRGKSSGLRTCWILGICTRAGMETLAEDQFEADLEDEVWKMAKASSREVEKSHKEWKYWGLRKRMAREKESLFGTGWV